MSGARLPTLPLPTVIAGQGVEEETLAQDSVVTSSKFGIAWPAEQTPSSMSLTAERPAGGLSSSEGETDISEEEFSPPLKRASKAEEGGGDSDFVTPTDHLHSDQNPMDQTVQQPPAPRLSRAFSMPLPSQLGPLQNPRRIASDDQHPSSTVIELPPEYGHFHELSLELADSVQMVIQTLLQLSPPQVLDPAKEQFSACSLSIPTPSISAMFTSMKNLNYMSANMSALSLDPPSSAAAEKANLAQPHVKRTDFDVGEMLQSVGDALSGVAAQRDVDLVLYHGDLGMKHVGVRGDESGISYTLSHVIRQVIGTASKGDTVEIGLFIDRVPASSRSSSPTSNAPTAETPESSLASSDDSLRCTFQISQRFALTDSDWVDASLPESRRASISSTSSSATLRRAPDFETLFLRRLLRHVGATLASDVEMKESRESFAGRMYKLSVVLERGSPSVVNPHVNLPPEDASSLGYSDYRIANEPTLEQLIQFAESLKSRKVALYANPDGSFAQHLTSYLTAWGLDVSHMSGEGDNETAQEPPGRSPENNVPPVDLPTPGSSEQGSTNSNSPSGGSQGSDSLSFVLIDDDVAVLRARLQKLKAELAYPLNLHPRKRPSLASNHRPRSSPQVVRVMGLTPATVPQPVQSQVVIVHFTSLANYKLVKDVIQSVLMPPNPAISRIPEVIVIPKPAGPRRVLTALHTAVTKPIVDPFFAPIATSPMSPGFHSPFFSVGTPKSPGARSTTSIRTASDKSARSPKDSFGDSSSVAPSSPRGVADGMEYFSDAAAKMGASPASGLIIQSPDGQPTGIYFNPKVVRNPRELRSPNDRNQPSERRRGVSFLGSHWTGSDGSKGGLNAAPQEAPRRSPRNQPTFDSTDPQAFDAHMRQRTYQVVAGVDPPALNIGRGTTGSSSAVPSLEETRSHTVPWVPTVKTSPQDHLFRHPSDPPQSPQRSPTAQPARRPPRRPTAEQAPSAPATVQKKGRAGGDGSIVPPISVLIVEDNPINQTILSTFMRRKKIKYDVAKNGAEAVEKWKSGGFHLILMDIQMPVMDGIQATKEIRRMERLNGASGYPSTPQSEGQRTPSEASASQSGTDKSAMTPPYRSSVIIVALTASSLQTDRVAALAAGCNDFLTKPVHLEWLDSKIIEWGSIKALQMWADIRPDVVKSISTGQAAQAQNVARRLHVPEGRSTPLPSRSRSSSLQQQRRGKSVVTAALDRDKTITPNTPLNEESPGDSSHSSDSAHSQPPFFPRVRRPVDPVAIPSAVVEKFSQPPVGERGHAADVGSSSAEKEGLSESQSLPAVADPAPATTADPSGVAEDSTPVEEAATESAEAPGEAAGVGEDEAPPGAGAPSGQ